MIISGMAKNGKNKDGGFELALEWAQSPYGFLIREWHLDRRTLLSCPPAVTDYLFFLF